MMIELRLPDQAVVAIMQILGKQPHNEVRALIDEITRQINAQRQSQDGNIAKAS